MSRYFISTTCKLTASEFKPYRLSFFVRIIFIKNWKTEKQKKNVVIIYEIAVQDNKSLKEKREWRKMN